ncbi:hypothetical protein KD146_17470 [Devosia sp. BSSL-BM10]|uniref:Uncharacterized protein n=1 Tax=Devosia litorisediminis TaxID=2829817 RepID=A0A942I7A4_9HYPH|nr:hypothetical protein [Devosia litorisediminis]MBS3850492.1 hypothetical protein [Devosia litorisediminis]
MKLQHDSACDTGAERYPVPHPYGLTKASGERLFGQIIAEKRSVRITREIGATEATTIHTQVASLFREAGWTVVAEEVLFSKAAECGVLLLFSDEVPAADVHAVRSALRMGGIEYE